MITGGALLLRALRAAGIDAVYGAPLHDVPVVAVSDPEVAALLATAHARVHRSPAAVSTGVGILLGGGVASEMPGIRSEDVLGIRAEDVLGIRPEDVVATRPEDLVAIGPGARLRLDLDLAAPAPDIVPARGAAPERWIPVDDAALRILRRSSSPAGLVGPGVIADGAVADLHAVAAAANLGVINTWGAKGVFDWRSRHHWATAGLQADDFALGGLADADVVLAVGLDPDETPPVPGEIVAVPAASLGPLAVCWSRPATELAVPPLRTRLAEVTQHGWGVERGPLPPSRVTLHYGQWFGTGGMVAADAGVSGYWVARTFATTELGSAQVPGRAAPGLAAACCVVARLRRPLRPVLAIVDAPVPEITRRVLDAALRLGVPLPVEVWDPAGRPLDADAHVERLRRMAAAPGDITGPATIATDTGQLREMIDAAGPVVAWGGLQPTVGS